MPGTTRPIPPWPGAWDYMDTGGKVGPWVTPGEIDDIPPAPTGVFVTLSAREINVPEMYRAFVKWNHNLAWGSNVCTAPIKEWNIELRPVNQSGQPLTSDGSPTVAGWFRKTATARHPTDEEMTVDPSLTRGEFVFDVADHPGEWCWQARLQGIDMLDRRGLWSPWSSSACAPPIGSQPGDLVKPPTPTGINIHWDVTNRDRHRRYRPIAFCNEITDPTARVVAYEFVLWRGDGDERINFKKVVRDHGDTDGFVRCPFSTVRKKKGYRAKVRSIDRHGHKSNWVTSGTSIPSDGEAPPPPINVQGDTKSQKVGIRWDSPNDPDQTDEPHPDIAFYQVQMATSPSFANIVRTDRYVGGEQKYFHTKDYNSFFSLRVRSVDAGGLKSAWVAVHNLKAEKPNTSSSSPEDIDWYNQVNIPLAGGQNSSAYVESIGGGPNLAYVDAVRFFDGEFFGEAKVQAATEVGFILRGSDDDNFLLVYLKTDGVYLAKYDAGVKTVLESEPLTLRENQIYKVVVNLEGAEAEVWVDGAHMFTYTTLAEKYLRATRFGMYIDTTTTRGEAIHHFRFTPTELDDAEIYDEFRRPNNDSDLGETDSEHTWVQQSGVWGVRHDPTPHGLFGASLVVPSFFADDISVHGFALPTSNVVPQTFDSVEFEIDRPSKIMVWGLATLFNPSSDYFVLRFYLPISPENEPRTWGKKLNVTIQPGQEITLTNVRHKFVNTNAPKLVTCGWGYQSAAEESPFVEVIYDVIEVRYQKMIVNIGYAPDFILEHDPNWTNSILTKGAYRTEEGDDFEG